MKTTEAPPMYQGLLHRLVERSNMDPTRGLSIAITSVNHGEGVSYITKTLALALEQMLVPNVLQLELKTLEHVREDPAEIYASLSGAEENLEQFARAAQPETPVLSGMWNKGLDSRVRLMQYLCARSNVILIDCPPLRNGNNTLSAAAVTDGVILVVQAGQTTKTDILFAERKIGAAGGTFEGYVLNKAPTIMPKWLHKHFGQRTR